MSIVLLCSVSDRWENRIVRLDVAFCGDKLVSTCVRVAALVCFLHVLPRQTIRSSLGEPEEFSGVIVGGVYDSSTSTANVVVKVSAAV